MEDGERHNSEANRGGETSPVFVVHCKENCQQQRATSCKYERTSVSPSSDCSSVLGHDLRYARRTRGVHEEVRVLRLSLFDLLVERLELMLLRLLSKMREKHVQIWDKIAADLRACVKSLDLRDHLVGEGVQSGRRYDTGATRPLDHFDDCCDGKTRRHEERLSSKNDG